jgi:hypothetical protein
MISIAISFLPLIPLFSSEPTSLGYSSKSVENNELHYIVLKPISAFECNPYANGVSYVSTYSICSIYFS